jgi:hypothetical protein
MRDIYSTCRFCWNVATYKWKVHNGKIEIISCLLVKFDFEGVGLVCQWEKLKTDEGVGLVC